MKEWVELGPTGLAIRVFRNKKAAAHFSVSHAAAAVCEMDRAKAVWQIRREVFRRDDYHCVRCGVAVTWFSGEMDERQARGACLQGDDGELHSGEVSVENCQTLCHSCHQGPKGKHQRQPQWTTGPGR